MLVLIIFFKKGNLRHAVATLSLLLFGFYLIFFTTLFTINFFVESSFGFICLKFPRSNEISVSNVLFFARLFRE